jgi:radical SAM protein with 4Fe4S-binding SPASM domain
MKIFGLKARKPYPTKLTLDINTQCNARCAICPYPTLKDQLSHGVMDWDLYRKIIDDFSTICYSRRIMGELSFCNMSEPTLLPNLPDYIRYAREKGCFTIYFNTNGSNLSPKLIDTFIRERTYPAMHLNIMVFSKENYARVMGLDFDRLVGNLKYLIEKYPHRLVDIGFFTELMGAGEAEAAREFFKDTKVLLHLATDVSDRASNVELPDVLSGFRSKSKERFFGCSKNRPIHRMHVNYDGRAYLCDQDMSLVTDFGNLKEKSIEEVWNGEAMMKALKILYGQAGPDTADTLPCHKCEACIDDERVEIFKDPDDYRPRKLFGPFKRWLVRRGWAVVRKRGKLAWV